MNKRIKKKRRNLDINCVCQGIKDMMTVKDHSVLLLTIDPKMTLNNYRRNIYNLEQIIDTLKKEHGITTVATMGDLFKFSEMNEELWKKLHQEYAKRELEKFKKDNCIVECDTPEIKNSQLVENEDAAD